MLVFFIVRDMSNKILKNTKISLQDQDIEHVST